MVRSVGLKPLSARWRALSREQALETLVCILRQDLAYGSEQMTASAAGELAAEFLGQFGPDAEFYGNGSFDPPFGDRSACKMGVWDPITEATLDSGVVAVDSDSVGVLWVEDED